MPVRPVNLVLEEDQAVAISLAGTDGSFTVEYDTHTSAVRVTADLPDGLGREGVLYEERFNGRSHTVKDALVEANRYLELACAAISRERHSRRAARHAFTPKSPSAYKAELKRLAESQAFLSKLPLVGELPLQEPVPFEQEAMPDT